MRNEGTNPLYVDEQVAVCQVEEAQDLTLLGNAGKGLPK